MKRGFTILEMLVASLLLGMLLSILTMLFNQSSIAWRTGTAGVSDLNEQRSQIAQVRREADNAYIWRNELKPVLSIWKENGSGSDKLNKRAIASTDAGVSGNGSTIEKLSTSDLQSWQVTISGSSQTAGGVNYSVNVRSAGPDKQFAGASPEVGEDDIWSFPDDFDL